MAIELGDYAMHDLTNGGDGRHGTVVSRQVVTHLDGRPDEVNVVLEYQDTEQRTSQAWFREDALTVIPAPE